MLLDGGDSINVGLEGFWPFVSGAGTLAFDLSLKRRNGLLTNFALAAGSGWKAGPFGPVLQFDGTNDYVPVNNFPAITRVTISAWVKSTGGGGNSLVVTKNFSGGVVPLALSVSSGAGSAVGMSFYNGAWRASGVNTEIQNDGKWHFVAGSYDGTTLRYYLDGKLDASSAYTGSLPSNTNPLEIGAYTAGGSYFAGEMSCMRIHSRALLSTEILRLSRERLAGVMYRRRRLYYIPATQSFTPIVMGTF